jgi:hypothetical protein
MVSRADRKAIECNIPDFIDEAGSLLDLLESDFGQSGADVRLEAIRCELQAAYAKGLVTHRPAQETAAVREFTTKLPKMGMSTVCDLCGETFGNHIAQHPDGRTSACPTVNRRVNS